MNGNLTLEMIYHPTLAMSFNRFQYFTFTITTLVMSLAVFLILKKSPPQMKLYKYLLLNQLFWSYLFDIEMTIWQPVLLFPFFSCYSDGPVQYFSFHSQHPLCATLIFIIFGMLHSIYFNGAYRVLSIYQDSSIYNIIDSPKALMQAFILSLCAILLLGNLPVITWLFTPINHEIIRENIIKDEPIMATVFVLEPSAGGCDWEQCKYMILTGAIAFLVAIAFFTIMIPTLSYLYTRQLFQVQNHHALSSSTLKLFKMLTKTLVFQAAYMFILFLIPLIFACFLFFTHNLWGSFYGQFAIFPISFHSFCETFTLLYMVRPYREYIYQLFTIFMKKYLQRGNNTISVAQIQVHSTQVQSTTVAH